MWGKLISLVAFITVVLTIAALGLEETDLGSNGSLNQAELPEISQSLMKLADQAMIYVEDNGKDRALEEFNNESGQFVEGDQYIIAFGFNGTCLAHPFRPELVGESQVGGRDVNGILIGNNSNNVASRGEGFCYWVNPNVQQNNTPELKLSYIKKVDDDWWLSSGTWLPDVPAVFNAESRLALVNLVDRAVEYAQENGKEKALMAFSDVNGDFVNGDLYVFAYDFNNTVLAHPIQPELIGKNRAGERDLYGVAIGCDIIDAAKEGTGLVYYTYPDPTRNMAPYIKLGYARTVDDDWWLGSGIYPAEADQDVAEDASPSYQPPASKEELSAFVETAASYARVYGKDIATTDFMDLDGPFVRGELYIFAYEFDGTCLSLPHLPSWIRTYLLDLQDPEGVYIIEEMSSIALNGSGFFDYVWTNPITNESEPKTSYVTKVDDDWWLGAGIYLSDEKTTAT